VGAPAVALLDTRFRRVHDGRDLGTPGAEARCSGRRGVDNWSRYPLGDLDGMNDESDDPYALSPEAIKEPPRELAKAIRQIGP